MDKSGCYKEGCYKDAVGVSQSKGVEAIRSAYITLATSCHISSRSYEPVTAASAGCQTFQALTADQAQSKTPLNDHSAAEQQLQLTTYESRTEEKNDPFKVLFRPTSYERGTVASVKHGAYVASVGAFSAPIKGVATMATVSGTGLIYGANTVRVGFCEGGRYVVTGAHRLVYGETVHTLETEHSTPIEMIAHGLSQPYVGIARGAYLFAAATASGIGMGLAGGVGGMAINLKEGAGELLDSATSSNRQASGALLLEDATTGCNRQSEPIEAIPVYSMEHAKMIETM